MIRSFAALLLLVGLAKPAAAHPVLTALESVFVQRDEVVVTMRIYAEDLTVFHDLRPDDLNRITLDQLQEAAPKHGDFLLQRLRVIDAAGEKLAGTVTKVDDSELTEPTYKMPELVDIPLVYTIRFPLESPPRVLSFSQDLVAPDTGFVSEVQLNVKQAGAPVETIRALKAGEPITLSFDWEATASEGETADDPDAWFAKQREKTLGIVDPNAAYARYYVTNRGLKLEFLIPFVGLESLLDGFIDREKRAFLEPDEFAGAREQITDYLREQNPVSIDGVEVAPRIDRIDFFEATVRDFGLPAEGRRISTVNSRVGLVLFYPAKEPPGHVEIEWTAFSRMVLEVDTLFFAPDGVFEPIFSKHERAEFFEWTSPGWDAIPPIEAVEAPEQPTLSIPVASTVCFAIGFVGLIVAFAPGKSRVALVSAGIAVLVGCLTLSATRITMANPFLGPPALDDEDAGAVFRTLLANTYRAFDYTAEGDVYDALAQSIDGPLLRETYLRITENLRMQDQGGAVAIVDEVVVLEGESSPAPPAEDDDAPGFRYRATWTVEGTVEHWGHLHSRTNRYTGLFTIRSRNGEWKITDLEILDEERVGSRTRVR